MCGDAIEGFVEGVGNFVVENPLVSNLITAPLNGLVPGLGQLAPFLIAPFHDFSQVDNDQVRPPYTRIKDLEGNGYKKNPANAFVEDFNNVTFEAVHTAIKDADDAVAPYATEWADIRTAIVEGIQNFQIALGALEQADLWKGKTHDAAINTVSTSLTEPQTAADGAGVMGILTEAFTNTIYATKQNIVPNYQKYQDDLAAHPEFQDEVKHDYNSFAQKVMHDVYAPTISQIAKDNPAFTQGGTPQPQPQPQPNLPTGAGLTNGPGSTGGPGLSGGPKSPNINGPKPYEPPKLPETKLPDPRTTVPTTPTGLNGLKGLTDPLNSALDAAKDAIGQAADAAKNAAQGGQGPNAGGPQGPPEGVLGLGPQGLGAAGASKGAGGAGGGPLPRGLANGKTMGVPLTAAAKTPAPAVGAGLSSAGGAPGAGAPAAGQRGGDQNGKGHQVNKALRRKKNGKQVIGDTDAVVAVVGAPEKASQPDAAQVDQPERSEQPEPASRSVQSAPRSAPRVEPPMRVPGQ